MNAAEVEQALTEAKFPGNLDAYNDLKAACLSKKVIAFVGAGASSPLYPTWTNLLEDMLKSARSEGMLTEQDLFDLQGRLKREPLEIATTLEEVLGKQIFRARLGSKFRNDAGSTSTHEIIIGLNFSGIVTLNYDQGLETAYTKIRHSMPYIIRAQDTTDLVRWLQGDLQNKISTPIAHLHGVPSDPSRMIITSSDYREFYSKPETMTFVQTLWRSERLFVIGFGFTDPFLTYIAESTMYDLPSDNRHFAFIGLHDGKTVSPLNRRSFTRKFRVRPIFYEVKTIAGEEDHSNLTTLLSSLKEELGSNVEPQSASPAPISMVSDARVVPPTIRPVSGFERDLFVAPNGKIIYVEPRFYSQNDITPESRKELVFSTIFTSDKSFLVFCSPEYGCTTLCKRLAQELRELGHKAFHHNAPDLPNYKKKLEALFTESSSNTEMDSVLVLENFDQERHERLLNELIGLKRFNRFIVCSSQGDARVTSSIDVSALPVDVEVIHLAHLSMADIRTFTETFYDSADTTMISSIVERIYEDLTDLCIPLTPANVIMFLQILCRDGNFQPLNRVQIIDRYISDILRRPGDAYHDAFNIKNKVDVVSSFVYHLYSKRIGYATEEMWSAFCREYMEETLIQFDDKVLLHELLVH